MYHSKRCIYVKRSTVKKDLSQANHAKKKLLWNLPVSKNQISLASFQSNQNICCLGVKLYVRSTCNTLFLNSADARLSPQWPLITG